METKQMNQVFALTSIKRGWELGITDFDTRPCCNHPNKDCTVLGSAYSKFVPPNSVCPTKYIYVIGSTGVNKGASFATCLLLVKPGQMSSSERELGIGGIVINNVRSGRRGY